MILSTRAARNSATTIRGITLTARIALDRADSGIMKGSFLYAIKAAATANKDIIRKACSITPFSR